MPKKKAGGKAKSASKKKKGGKLSKSSSKAELPPVPVAEPKPDPNACVYHMKETAYYCETCEYPVCYACTVMGPHNTQLHRISTIKDAFGSRYDMMVGAIKTCLIPKRTQLIAQITRVDYRIEEIKTVKGIIDRDVKNEYGGVIERLNSAEGVKLAILQHDIAELQKDVNRIDEILQHLDELNSAPQPPPVPAPVPVEGGAKPEQPVQNNINMVGFLSKYKRFQEDVDYSITKQFKVDIPVIPNDLPRELAEKRMKLEEYEKQKIELKQKDELILRLVEEKKARELSIKEELDTQTRQEITQWVNLVDNYAEELKKFQLICTFCGVHLDHIAVNLDCPKNPLVGDVKDFMPPEHFFSSIVPPKEFFATGRHFFVKPDPEDDDITNDEPSVNDSNISQYDDLEYQKVVRAKGNIANQQFDKDHRRIGMGSYEALRKGNREDEENEEFNQRATEYMVK